MKSNSYQRVLVGIILVTIMNVYSVFTESPDYELNIYNFMESVWVTLQYFGLLALFIGLLLEVYYIKSKCTPPKWKFLFLGCSVWVACVAISQQFIFHSVNLLESVLIGLFIGIILSWSHYWNIEQENNAYNKSVK